MYLSIAIIRHIISYSLLAISYLPIIILLIIDIDIKQIAK